MKLFSAPNLGMKGISLDAAPWNLPPEYLTEASGVHVYSNSIRADFSPRQYSAPASGFDAGHLFYVQGTSGNWIILGSEAWTFDGATWSDITSVAGYAGVNSTNSNNWTSCMLGRIPIVNHELAHPEYWSPQSPTQVLQPLEFSSGLTWLARGLSCKAIRSHKNILFALNLTDGATEYPTSYRWSHPADINGLPFTWDETDTSGLAGVSQVAGSGGVIVDGLSLGDDFIIYSETAITMLSPTQDEFVWKAVTISDTYGAINKECIVDMGNYHLVMTRGDIIRVDGSGAKSIIDGTIREALRSYSNASFYDKFYAVKVSSRDEAWFAVVTTETGPYPDLVFIYGATHNAWTKASVPPVPHMNEGFVGLPSESWANWAGTWDEGDGTWGDRIGGQLTPTVLFVDSNNSSLYFTSHPDGPEAVVNSCIERVSLVIDSQTRVTTISRVYPYMTGTQPVYIQVGSQDFARSPVRWKPPVLFTPGVDRKIDVRSTGELHCYKIYAEGLGYWILNGMDFEYEEAGAR